jgi:hypothetical protein
LDRDDDNPSSPTSADASFPAAAAAAAAAAADELTATAWREPGAAKLRFLSSRESAAAAAAAALASSPSCRRFWRCWRLPSELVAIAPAAGAAVPWLVAAGWLGLWLRAGCYCVALLLAVPPLAASNIWSRR